MAIFDLAGHNNRDTGAIGVNGRQENKETIAFRQLVAKYIYTANYKVIQDDDNDSLAQMLQKLRSGDGSVCVEWHFDCSDSPTSTGCSAFIDEKATHLSKLMAIDITNTISSVLDIRNRGVFDSSQSHRGRLAMPKMVGTTCLVEICFISNPNDMDRYDANKEALAKKLAGLLMRYDDAID